MAAEYDEEGTRPARPGRRRAMKQLAAAVVAGGAGAAAAQAPPAETLTPAEIAAAERVTGRSFTPAERELMAPRIVRTRARLKALRAVDPGERVEPATHFDPRLPGTALPAGPSRFRLSGAPTPSFEGNPERVAFASAAELSRLLKARKITSVALTHLYLERLKQIGPRLNCVVTLTEALALEQAERADREIAAGRYRGPLHGIPWGAKDLLATGGIRTTWGAKPYENQVFDYDATVVERLAAAGAVLVAKLTTGELAQGDVWFGGMTRTPWDPALGSSGSSAGPGSATAAGLVGFSIGSETLGSIVSPSVRNGVTGLRPTYGRVPRSGAMSLCWTMDKLGPMCRAVEDCAMVLNAIAGPDGRDGSVVAAPFRWEPDRPLSDLRVGIDAAAFEQVRGDAARRPIYDEVLATLARLGVRPRPITLPAQTEAYAALPGLTIDVESAASFMKLMESGRLAELARQTEGAWPNTFRTGSTVPAVDYLQALRVRRRLQEEMARTFEGLDCYVTVPFAGPTLAYTNLTGHPSLVTRCGMRDGKPESIEFIGALYREDAILRLGHAFERVTSWHSRWPDTSRLPPLPG